MKLDRYEPKQNAEKDTDSCNYCHNTTLQQVGNEKVCPHCGTRVYSTSLIAPMALKVGGIQLSVGSR